jgi:hypothetical protein
MVEQERIEKGYELFKNIKTKMDTKATYLRLIF